MPFLVIDGRYTVPGAICTDDLRRPDQSRPDQPVLRDARKRWSRMGCGPYQRISRTTSWPAVTVGDMSRRWRYAGWRRHAGRAGAGVSVAETPQRQSMRQPALARCRKMPPPGVL